MKESLLAACLFFMGISAFSQQDEDLKWKWCVGLDVGYKQMLSPNSDAISNTLTGLTSSGAITTIDVKLWRERPWSFGLSYQYEQKEMDGMGEEIDNYFANKFNDNFIIDRPSRYRANQDRHSLIASAFYRLINERTQLRAAGFVGFMNSEVSEERYYLKRSGTNENYDLITRREPTTAPIFGLGLDVEFPFTRNLYGYATASYAYSWATPEYSERLVNLYTHEENTSSFDESLDLQYVRFSLGLRWWIDK